MEPPPQPKDPYAEALAAVAEDGHVVELRKRYGLTLVQPFVQDARHARLGDRSPLKKDFRGFCEGACLDWIRKAVLGARPHYNVAAEHGVHSRPSAPPPPATVPKPQNEALAMLGKLRPAGPKASVPDAPKLKDKDIRRREDDQTLRMEEVAQVRFGYLKEAGKKKTTYKDFWQERIRATLDNQFRVIRQEGERPETTRPFSKLQLVDSVGQGDKAPLSEVFAHFFRHGEVHSSANAALLAMWWTEGETERGHAVALRPLDEGKYHLFDPNYGCFRCPSGRGSLNRWCTCAMRFTWWRGSMIRP
jgi:hypothetical protein